MSVQTKTYLKSRFETNDIPTQTDFEDVFDSYVHVNDGKREFVDVGAITIPAGTVLEKIFLRTKGAGNIRIGTTNGGSEIMPDTPVVNAEDYIFIIDQWANLTSKTIYVTGVSADMYIKEHVVKLTATS